MQITNGTNLSLSSTRPVAPPQADRGHSVAPQTDKGPDDTVALGSRHRDNRLGFVGSRALLGAVPVVGAVTNFGAMLVSGLGDKPGMSELNLAAIGSNLIGTGALVTGLLSGNSLATNIGLGMLGISGLAAGATAYSIS